MVHLENLVVEDLTLKKSSSGNPVSMQRDYFRDKHRWKGMSSRM